MKLASVKTFALVALAAAPLLASAQLTGNVALTSNYKFRGQDQDIIASDGTLKTSAAKPALQGGFDYAFGDSGFYVGNWNSSVNWLPGNSLETDVYGGYKFKAGGADWDVGALAYLYPGATAGNTVELYGAGTFGPVTAKYSHTVSKDYFGWAGAKAGTDLKGRNTGYFNLAFAQEVAAKTTLKASVGYTRFASDIKDNGRAVNYVDYSVGGAYDLGSGAAFSLAVTGATKKEFYDVNGPVNKPRLIVTLSKTL